MPITGAESHVSMKTETTYGASITPTVALPFFREQIRAERTMLESSAVYVNTAAGINVDQFRPDIQIPQGPLEMPLVTHGQEELWRAIMGETYAYATSIHSFSASAIDKSLSVVVAMGAETTASARWITGAIVRSWSLDIRPAAVPVLRVELIGKTETITNAPAVSLPSNIAMFAGGADVSTITLNAAAFDCVTAIRLEGRRNLDIRREHNATVTRDQRIETSASQYGATFTVDFESFTSNPNFMGSNLTGGTKAFILELDTGSSRISFEGDVRFDGNTPVVHGMDVLQVDVPMVFVSTAGASPLVVEVENGTATL